MMGYVKFLDGHLEKILDGHEFDDLEHPTSLHHTVVHTCSGIYRKTIRKDSKFGRAGSSMCVGYGLADRSPIPVAISGYNGVVDVVLHDQTAYKYEIRQDGWAFSGVVVVTGDADIRDVHSAIIKEFDSVNVVKIKE